MGEVGVGERGYESWSVAGGCDGKKKRGRAAPPVLQRCDRSEALFVTGRRRAAAGVVQEEVERTASEIDQLRHLVGDVGDADRELRVPRQLRAGLQVMSEPAVGGARAGAVGADVAGDVAHAPVAAAALVVQC